MKITMNWEELVNSYNDDNQTFERYICDQLGIEPAGCFVETEDGEVTTDEAYGILKAMLGSRTFTVTPNAEYISWRGTLDSDFRVAMNGGWTNAASAANGRKGGRPRRAEIVHDGNDMVIKVDGREADRFSSDCMHEIWDPGSEAGFETEAEAVADFREEVRSILRREGVKSNINHLCDEAESILCGLIDDVWTEHEENN